MYEDRVARGAALLDRMRPGWATEIAADRLAMESCTRCILGQLYGNYADGFDLLLRSLPSTEFYSAAGHGFTLWNHEQACFFNYPLVVARFERLAEAWRVAIRERLETGAGGLHVIPRGHVQDEG